MSVLMKTLRFSVQHKIRYVFYELSTYNFVCVLTKTIEALSVKHTMYYFQLFKCFG